MAYPPYEQVAFNASKEAILNLMRTKKCADVGFVNAASTSYADLIPLLFAFAKTFDCDPNYLVSILNEMDDAVLIANSIYLNKTVSTLVNPKWVVNCTVDLIEIVGSTGHNFHEGLEVVKNSAIAKILVHGSIRVKHITISTSSVVDELEVVPGSCLESMHIKSCNGDNAGTLSKLISESCVENTGVDEDAVFGGIFCKPQTLS